MNDCVVVESTKIKGKDTYTFYVGVRKNEK